MKRTAVVTIATSAVLAAGAAVAVSPAEASGTLGRSSAPKVVVPKAAAPSANQQITAAVRHSKLLGAVSADNITVSGIKFAASDKSWAAATVTPKNGQTDPAQVVLHKTGSTWQVRDLGTFGVGCGSAPAAVRASLGLHGPC
ncbi:hypothetical protein [Flexivirga meconopsidis]|uniref:hypothetical protein n=1 Tax=Flexivirga meconopsidis TaxID=2977121 RepID=UPI0022409E97|nr:hypothetical protein [Flexivirga meconopsidis]